MTQRRTPAGLFISGCQRSVAGGLPNSRKRTPTNSMCSVAAITEPITTVSRGIILSGWFAALLLGSAAAAESVRPIGLGDPGALLSISIESGRGGEGPLLLIGNEPRQQLVVTGKYASGQRRDLTRSVRYGVSPTGVVAVDPSGLVTPQGNGTATIRATVVGTDSEPHDATVEISVESFTRNPEVNFPNQVVPILTKLQCNSGGCHGKSGGQNGFRLSLLGFEPQQDYEHLSREARGRRLNLSAPDLSLLLQKASGVVPHGGGARMEIGSHNYRLVRRWIAEGASYGDPDARRVSEIEVLPRERMMGPESQQQLVVIARYTDGSTADVTATAQYEANVAELAEVTDHGLVTTTDQSGDVAVMVRYQSQVAVFRATIPLGAPVETMPSENNFVDEKVFEKLRVLGIPPSETCDDATFLRRVTIDIAGRLPTEKEAVAFLADRDPAKRDRRIDHLLDSADYADYFAKKWAAIFRNKRVTAAGDDGRHGTYAFHAWIRKSLYENRPYDEFVRGVLAASGDAEESPGVIWYRTVRDANAQAEDAAQLFLGTRMQCAQCHHHPFEKWSQRDYYRLTSFFSQVGRKPGALPTEERIFHRRGVATAVNPRDDQQVLPAGLGSEPMVIPAEEDPRQRLVDWMATPENPFFARTLANRYWKHFFSRGLVEPEDDMRETNPATNPELLDALAEHFIDSGFDMKALIRTICRSQTYQLSSLPNKFNEEDRQNFSRYYPKRLPAEVLLDAVDAVAGSETRFQGMPAGTRAVQLPDSGFRSHFLNVFGRPEGNSACECERTSEANLAQGLHLLNSSDMVSKLSADGGRAAQLAADNKRETRDKIRELYLAALTRLPTDDEAATVAEFIKHKSQEKGSDTTRAFEDVLWALINTKEFLFNH